MKKNLTLFFCFFAFMFVANAQTKKVIRCATDEYYQNEITNNPALQQSYLAAAQQTRTIANNIIYTSKGKAGNSVPQYIIPVVVHILYNTAADDLADSTVYTNLQRLNDDYRRTNFDTATTRNIFKSIAADTKVEFRLAVRDPNGNCTNGIIHKYTSATSFNTTNKMKSNSTNGDDPWNTSAYLNLWVCTISGGILGYAQFPGGTAATDGVVINNTAFGEKGAAQAPYDLGRTLTHEVGHWLNLYHTFQGGCAGMNAGNCASSGQGDECCDTPPTSSANYGCPASQNTCNESYAGDRVDMTENYMDYTDDACMNAFTIDQTARIQATLMGVRNGLVTSLGLTPVTGTPLLTVSNDTICNGGTVSVTASGANTYFWSPSKGLNSNSTATVIASPTVTTTYTVYTTNTTNHCTAWAQDTILVLGASTNIAVSPTKICLGIPQKLTASGGRNYTWSPTSGISNSTHDTVTAFFTTPTTYTITTHDTIGGIACTASKNVFINVNSLPNISINKTAVCNGKATNITASGANTYNWNPSTGLANPNVATVSATLTSPTSYIITGTNNSTGCSDTIHVNIAVNPNPNVTLNNSNVTICQGSSTPIIANGANTYNWSPTANLSPSSGANVTASPISSQTYTVTGIASATGCSNTASIVVNVNPLPDATFTTSLNITDVTFTSSIFGSTYNWSFGDGSANSTQASPTHTYTQNGNYTACLTITDNNSCSDSTCQTIVITNVGINQPKLIVNNVSISPNPATDNCLLQFSLAKKSTITIDVIDVLGRKIAAILSKPLAATEHQINIKTTDWASGIYFIKIQNAEGQSIVQKLVKR
ncbi:MAG: hypothetical protein RJA07_548 [Bacteroidota bacterium]